MSSLDEEIEQLLGEFTPEEQEALLRDFEATHQFYGPHGDEDETE